MLKQKMVDAINTQIGEELYSFYLYLAMSEYFRAEKLMGFAHWMNMQAQEEMAHAQKMIGYLHEQFGRTVLKGIPQPPKDWKSPLAAFEQALKHEQHITASINKLVDLAGDLHDHATNNFLAWFVDEQVEEEHNATLIVDKLNMVSKVPAGLYMLDRELAARGK